MSDRDGTETRRDDAARGEAGSDGGSSDGGSKDGRMQGGSDGGRAGRAASDDRPAPTHDRARSTRAARALARLAAAALLIVGAAAVWGWTRLAPVDPGTPDTVEFEVLPGWGASRIASELEAGGLVRDATVFSAWLRLRELDRGVGEGLYDLSPSQSAREIARNLAEGGRPRTARLVVPEGLRADEVAERLDALGVAEEAAVREAVADPGDLAPSWLPDDAGLEGYLYPDTYELRRDVGAETALATLVAAFESMVADGLGERVEAEGLSLHDWTILASMIQAEAAGPDEMAIIAGVFRNRLDRGMLLQSDPTVAYGLGKRLPELSAVDGDMRADHPWNTYLYPGLPAGPIGSPGRDALEAVLAPERTAPGGEPWLYFLHGLDGGRPVFRPNIDLASHERDIDRYLR